MCEWSNQKMRMRMNVENILKVSLIWVGENKKKEWKKDEKACWNVSKSCKNWNICDFSKSDIFNNFPGVQCNAKKTSRFTTTKNVAFFIWILLHFSLDSKNLVLNLFTRILSWSSFFLFFLACTLSWELFFFCRRKQKKYHAFIEEWFHN